MKTRLLLLSVLLVVSACGLFSSPQATVKKFMRASEKGDLAAMTQLFSSRALKRDGSEKIKENNRKFAELSQRAAADGSYQMNNLTESKEGNNARVGFHYQNKSRSDSIRLVFALTNEDGSWKIDNIGGGELEEISDLSSAELKDPPVKRTEPVVETPAIAVPDAPTAPTSSRAPVSGGVLNDKATTLPQPVYPPIARGVKASGTVVVEVEVDENGNVVKARAISGHPLLQAASVAAARLAKFPPTKLSGQPVRVTGLLNYSFPSPS